MAILKIGDTAPAVSLPDETGTTVTLADFKGKPVVIYFYPKDDTPGCTAESCDFRDNLTAFSRTNVQILGISKDSVKSHAKFKEKYGLNFPLLADTETKAAQDYGVWVEKSMMGKKYMGTERSTFLIDASGKIAAIWPKVSVTGHVGAVLKAVEELAS